MLAYVFWHRPLEAAGYETKVIEYHRALAQEAVDGFHGSQAFAVAEPPWLPGGAAFEDWYLLEAAWALDSLAAAAVSGRLEAPHRRVAGLTGAMAAGLYRLQSGEPNAGARAAWLTEAPSPDSQATVWRRQLVLGPTPEFCVVTDGPVAEGGTILSRRRIA